MSPSSLSSLLSDDEGEVAYLFLGTRAPAGVNKPPPNEIRKMFCDRQTSSVRHHCGRHERQGCGLVAF